MIKAILFDLGGVLTNNSFDSVLKEITDNLGINFEDLKRIKEEYDQELLAGKLSVSDFNKILKQRLNLNLSLEKITLTWEKSYRKVRIVNEKLYSFAKHLKKNYMIGMISNIYDLMAKIDKERGIFEIFNTCILSCEVGLTKPNKEIFELSLRELNLESEECIFIDDRGYHLIEPKKLGFKTILFQDNKQVVEELEKLLNN